jgi:hypothetical protein
VKRLILVPREDRYVGHDSDEALLARRLARDGGERATSLLVEWDFETEAMVTRRPERWQRALREGRVDWVEWGARGRLAVLVDGRVDVAPVHTGRIGPFVTLADFSADQPHYVSAPRWAATWKGV